MMTKQVVMDWFRYNTASPPPPPVDTYLAEDGTTEYVAEDGTTVLVPEN